MRSATGAVRFADYGNKFANSLEELCDNLKIVNRLGPIELYQHQVSAVVVNGWGQAIAKGEFLGKIISKGAVLVLEGVSAITTLEEGVTLAFEVVPLAVAGKVPSHPPTRQYLKGSFEAYRDRTVGRPVIRLPEMYISAGKGGAPRADWLTGVQYRLNALGFAAGQVDGILGPRTKKAVTAFQRSYPPLLADGVPGPKTQAKLVSVCGY